MTILKGKTEAEQLKEMDEIKHVIRVTFLCMLNINSSYTKTFAYDERYIITHYDITVMVYGM